IVARLGGDEFLIICPDTGLEDGLVVAESVRAKVNAMRVSAGEGEWHGSISVGVSARTQAMEGPEMLIKSADLGVYQAKEDGRNCVRTRDNQNT
ncbi:MAG: GGDEF domain-containing protein, partial [Oceanospirillaceae bacterium]|nr:GGDEF domain-containing protein [Oceanospirillaceae bacterium]